MLEIKDKPLVKPIDLKADYARTTPPPHGKPFNGVRSVWGVQVSGKHGFVVDKRLPY